jgi:hypothetical protein
MIEITGVFWRFGWAFDEIPNVNVEGSNPFARLTFTPLQVDAIP